MKKLIIISDTHGNTKGLEKLRPLIAENDYVVHLGDGGADMRELRGEYPEKVYQCGGNCDFFSPLPEDGELEIEGVKVYYCHGHKYHVKSELTALAAEAKRRGCDIALYGHTHIAKITEMEGVMLINPGSLRRAVGEGGSYCYLVINKEKATPVLVGESVF
ncbi:MAG: metallophosphoesterase [Clostridia bacterium]|nr:metallophosphoesterase [Clostridia bacterium]